MLSADGIDKGFEYSRYPAEWSVYEDTLQRYVDAGITPTISYGVSVYSIFNLIESIEYYYNRQIPVWLNIVYDANTSIAALPEEVKRQVTEDIKTRFNEKWNDILQEKTIDGVVNYMNNTQMDFLNIRNDINKIDTIREQNFNDVFSGLEEYLNGG